MLILLQLNVGVFALYLYSNWEKWLEQYVTSKLN